MVPTRCGSRGLLTSWTTTESRPDITNSGAVFMKQPEIPAEPGLLSTRLTLGLIATGTFSPASCSARF